MAKPLTISLLGTGLPPGPKGLPFVGHFFRMKDVLRPDILMKLKREYGTGLNPR